MNKCFLLSDFYKIIYNLINYSRMNEPLILTYRFYIDLNKFQHYSLNTRFN